jgi:para-nitrobenzyl esterase
VSITKNTVVETLSGKLDGTFEDSLYVFKGIPYAAPPVGKLRWLPPEPCHPWTGVRSAHDFGAVSLQNMMIPTEQLNNREPQSEDCLFLNVWTPGLDDTRRPVMVWIHGGGFVGGSGSSPTYRGDILAKRGNIVTVTINYRLGVLGFLNLDEVTKGIIPASGSQGLLDQIMALKWIRDNIDKFGGDPSNVTVFGESAGGMSISCLLSMDQAHGLFQKAIPQSGGPNVIRPLEGVVKTAGQFLEILGIKNNGADALWSLPAQRLLLAQAELSKRTGGVTPVEPLLDGKVIKAKPMDRIKAGSASGVKVLCGATLEETKFFSLMNPKIRDIDDAGLYRKVQIIAPGKADTVIGTYRRARAKRGLSLKPYDLLTAIQTDGMFRAPMTKVAEAQFKNNQKAFNYLFTWQSPAEGGALGACHSLELGFLFGTCTPEFNGSGPGADQLSSRIQEAWIAFARSGDPSCDSLGHWPQYDDKRKTMILGEKCYIEEAPYEEERAVWDTIGEVSPALALS